MYIEECEKCGEYVCRSCKELGSHECEEEVEDDASDL
jgi:hypothetical protein